LSVHCRFLCRRFGIERPFAADSADSDIFHAECAARLRKKVEWPDILGVRQTAGLRLSGQTSGLVDDPFRLQRGYDRGPDSDTWTQHPRRNGPIWALAIPF